MRWAWLVVAEPGAGKISRSIGMAAAAGFQQILLNDCTLRIIYLFYVVNAMAVNANRLVGLLTGSDGLEHLHRRPVKIAEVGVENVGVYMIFVHQLLVGMTFGADLRRKKPEWAVGWALNIVNAVTIDTARHIRIALSD